MKKRKLTAAFVALSMVCMFASFPVQAASQTNIPTKTVDGLTFAVTVPDEEIESITPEERMILEREISGTIVSTATLPCQVTEAGTLVPVRETVAPYALTSNDVSTRVTIGHRSSHVTISGTHPSFEVVFTATWRDDRPVTENNTDLIGITWNDAFLQISGTQEAYTVYENAIDSGFRYDGDYDDVYGEKEIHMHSSASHGVSFAVPLFADEYMIVCVSEIYTPDHENTEVDAHGAYAHTIEAVSVSGISFGIPAGFSVDFGMSDVVETYAAGATMSYHP